MRYLLISILSILFFTACEDKGFGTEDVSYVPVITSGDSVKILSSTPKDIVAKKAYISIEFSSYMNLYSLNISNISLFKEDGSSVAIEVESIRNFLYIKPLSSLVDTKNYTLVIKKSIEDIMGNQLDRDYSHTFTCKADFWESVEAGSTHSMAMSKEGDIFIWGSNLHNQIIDVKEDYVELNSSVLSRSIPLGIIGLNGAKSYSAGGSFSSVVKSDTSLFTNGEYSLLNLKESNLSMISAGDNHVSYVKLDGTLWSWGENSNGQLGNLGIFAKLYPVQEYSRDNNWSVVSAGENFSIALKNDGTLWGWGDNSYGQIGDDLSKERRFPFQEVTAVTDWSSVSAGGKHSVMLKKDGTLWSFGDNTDGQLGDGTNIENSIAVQEQKGFLWRVATAGYNHSCAIKKDNTLWCWGSNRYGQLGINSTENQNIAVQVGSETTWKTVSAGNQFTLATKSDGTLWTWGYNAYYQLGLDKDATDKLVPVEVK